MSTYINYIIYTITKGMLDLLGDLKVLYTVIQSLSIYIITRQNFLLCLGYLFSHIYIILSFPTANTRYSWNENASLLAQYKIKTTFFFLNLEQVNGLIM